MFKHNGPITAVMVLIFCLGVFRTDAAADGKSLPELVSQAKDSIVSLSTPERQESAREDELLVRFYREFYYGRSPLRSLNKTGLGSGVIIDSQGYILTNEHLISGSKKIVVTLLDGRSFPARIKAVDPASDLAVLKIAASGLKAAVLGNSDKLLLGERVLALGNPFAFTGQSYPLTATQGIISALHRPLPKTPERNRSFMDLIWTDAAIAPGSSGGALLNSQGEVIGISTVLFNSHNGDFGVSFAVPINQAKVLYVRLLKGEEVLYSRLGIRVQDINEGLARYFGLKTSAGVLITEISADSPAKTAGLKVEDVIVRYGEHKIKDTLDFFQSVSKSASGEKVRLKIIRNTLMRTVYLHPETAKPAEHSAVTQKKALPLAKKSKTKTPLSGWRGIKVEEITAQVAANFDLPVKTGVIIISIRRGSSAENGGLQVNDIIEQVNNFKVQTVADFSRACAESGGNVLIKTNRGFFMVTEK